MLLNPPKCSTPGKSGVQQQRTRLRTEQDRDRHRVGYPCDAIWVIYRPHANTRLGLIPGQTHPSKGSCIYFAGIPRCSSGTYAHPLDRTNPTRKSNGTCDNVRKSTRLRRNGLCVGRRGLRRPPSKESGSASVFFFFVRLCFSVAPSKRLFVIPFFFALRRNGHREGIPTQFGHKKHTKNKHERQRE